MSDTGKLDKRGLQDLLRSTAATTYRKGAHP